MRFVGSDAFIFGLLTMKNGWRRVNEGLDCGKEDGNARRIIGSSESNCGRAPRSRAVGITDKEIRLSNFNS